MKRWVDITTVGDVEKAYIVKINEVDIGENKHKTHRLSRAIDICYKTGEIVTVENNGNKVEVMLEFFNKEDD